MIDGIDLSGFTAGEVLVTLPAQRPPRDPGVYVVIRPVAASPTFREVVPYRGDAAFPLADLHRLWVPDAQIVYIGKADHGADGNGLRRRLRQLRRYGAGGSARHSGGRRIWQLEDYPRLLVAWRPTDRDQVPRSVESALIAQFRAHHGARPFANDTD